MYRKVKASPTNCAQSGSNGRNPNKNVFRSPRENSCVCSVAVLARLSASSVSEASSTQLVGSTPPPANASL
jgi:hypothetical protein